MLVTDQPRADPLVMGERAAGHEGLAAVLCWAPVRSLPCVGVGVLSQLLLCDKLEVAVLAGKALVVNVVHLDVSLHLLLVDELFATDVTVEEPGGVSPFDVVLDITGLDKLSPTSLHRAADGCWTVNLPEMLPQLGLTSRPEAALGAGEVSLSVKVPDVLPQ